MKKKLTDAQLDDLRDRNPCQDIAAQRYGVKLRRHGNGFIGSCPLCSTDLKSGSATRFEIKDAGRKWVCASCGQGGDVIKLVQLVEGISFRKACDSLGGAADIDPAEEEKRAAVREARAAKAEAEGAAFRENERKRAYEILKHAIKADVVQPESRQRTSAAAYLYGPRGLAGLPLDRFYCIEDMPYYDGGKRDAVVLHRGPALLAPIWRDGKFAGLHTTWIDLDQPKGKAAIRNAAGDAQPARKVRGSKKGGHIVVAEPDDLEFANAMVLGEGIEKVGKVYLAQAVELEWQHTYYWSSVDLGNLGGKAAETVTHPTLKGDKARARRVPGPVPDMKEPGIEIPASIQLLTILADTTSDRFETLCAIARAVRRFARDGLRIVVAWPAEGMDFDDMTDEAAIARAIADAKPFDFEAEIAKLAAGAPAQPATAPAQTNGAGAAGDRSAFPPFDYAALPPADADDPPPPDYPADAGIDADDPPPPADPGAYGAAAAFAAVAPHAGGQKGQPSRSGGSRKRSGDRATWGGDPLAPAEKKALDRELAYFPQTDLGNIERFTRRYRGRLMFCQALGWLVWTGGEWSREGAEGYAKRAEHETVRAIQDEARVILASRNDDEPDDYLIKIVNKGKDDERELWFSDTLAAWGRASENASRLNPISTRAAPYLSVEAHQLDADPFKVNLLNGTLVIRRGGWAGETLADGWDAVNDFIRIKPHDPRDLITKRMPVEYDVEARCPLYDAFLQDVQPDPDVRAFLDVWDAYSLTGDASEQRLVFHHGTGKNGKSTQTSLRLWLAGGYGQSIPIESFVNEGKSKAGGQATPDLAMLRGARTVLTSEPEKNWRLNEGLIKLLTGGDTMKVRELHRPFFDLEPEFKITMSGNYKPRIDGGEAESGIWRRVVLVPWGVVISKEKRDMALGAKLRAEGPGIVNRWLAALAVWCREGLQLPDEVAKATEKFREESDPLGRFLSECVFRAAGDRVGATELYNLFVAWARANGEVGRHDWTAAGFGNAMRERGFEKIKNNIMQYMNIRATKTINDFVDRDGKPFTNQPAPGAEVQSQGGISPDTVEM